MTPDDRKLILSLVVVPGRPFTGDKEDVLRHFGVADGSKLGLDLLRDAISRQDAVDVEMALIVTSNFGVTPEFLGPLVQLCLADWHTTHEDVVAVLGQLREPTAVPALYEATQFIPEYLEYDDSRALARKAIWAIGGTPGREAEQALLRLTDSDDEILCDEAARQLERRRRSRERLV